MTAQRVYLNKEQHPAGTRLLYVDVDSKGQPREVLVTEWSASGRAWRGSFTNEYCDAKNDEKTRRWHTDKPEVFDLLEDVTVDAIAARTDCLPSVSDDENEF